MSGFIFLGKDFFYVMFNFAHFIPGTLDADYLRQQVSERGILEKIDALNELVKQCLGKDQSMSDFYRMIADIEDNLNRNMNDPRARSLINTFTKEPTPANNTIGTDNTAGTDNTTGTNDTTGTDNTTGADNTTGSDNTTGTDNTAGSDNTIGPDNTTGSDNTANVDNTTGTDNTAGTKPATKRGTRKSKDTE